MGKDTVRQEAQHLFTRGLYITEYKLLVVLDQNEPDEEDVPIVIDRSSHIYGSCRLAAYLYLYLILREMPPSAEINKTLVLRLKTLLESNHKNLLSVWRDDLYLLLWIATVGSMAARLLPEAEYFVEILTKVVQSLGLQTMDGFKDVIGQIVWIEDYCREATSSYLWDRIKPGASSESAKVLVCSH